MNKQEMEVLSLILNPVIESMTESEKESQQSQLLQKLVERAYEKTNFYRQQLQNLGLTPDDIQTIHDISKLPFMNQADLSANFPYGLLTIPVSGIVRLQQTTDASSVIGFTKQDIAYQIEMLCCNLAACQITMSSMIMMDPHTLDTGSMVSLQHAAETLGATVISSSMEDELSIIKTMLDFGATTIVSTPSTLLQLADFLKQKGYSASDLPLMNILCEAHQCSSDIRKALELEFKIPVYTIYGLLEVMNLGIAGECHSQSLLHIHEDHFYAEIIDPVTGALLGDFEPGELVLTTLSREAMPLIRYRTGDIALLNRQPCPCGRTSARLQLILPNI